MISLENLVAVEHIDRKFNGIWNFASAEQQLKSIENDNNYKGYGVLRLVKCLLLQFLENLSDRGLER